MQYPWHIYVFRCHGVGGGDGMLIKYWLDNRGTVVLFAAG